MNLKAIVLSIIVLAVIAYFGVAAYIASVLTVQAPSPIKYDRDKIGRGTDVVFKSTDNAQLAGWYFPGTNDKAIMFVHGAGSQNRANEVYGAPDIAKYFLEQGYTILMFDLRGTGQSQEARISFGQNESKDVAGAFNYLVKQEYKPESIGIISDSLGAIATVLAADTIKTSGGIVLDSPATEVKPIVSNIMTDEHSIPGFFFFFFYLWAKILYQVDVDSVRPVDHISVLKNTPLLFFFFLADTLIPPSNSATLLSMVSSGNRVTFPNTKHVETFKTLPDLYLKTVSEFFTKNLK